MTTYTITKSNFLNWYYNTGCDQSQEQMRVALGEGVIEHLLVFNQVVITAQDIFEEADLSSMPIHFLETFRGIEHFMEVDEAVEKGILTNDFEIKLI